MSFISSKMSKKRKVFGATIEQVIKVNFRLASLKLLIHYSVLSRRTAVLSPSSCPWSLRWWPGLRILSPRDSTDRMETWPLSRGSSKYRKIKLANTRNSLK